MGTRKDVSLTRFTGKYIKGNWDIFFFSLFDKKGNNSKFIQAEGVISGKEKDRHLKNFHPSHCVSAWPTFSENWHHFQRRFSALPRSQRKLFFFFFLLSFNPCAKETRPEMIAGEEVGQDFFWDKNTIMGVSLEPTLDQWIHTVFERTRAVETPLNNFGVLFYLIWFEEVSMAY